MKYLELFSTKEHNQMVNNMIEYINLCMDKIIKTRNQKLRSTSSCRLWQFKFMLIYIYNKLTKNKILKNINSIDIITDDLLYLCGLISETINSKSKLNINDLILNNNIDYALPIDNIIELKNPDNLYCMCIYSNNIIHFFTIFVIDDKYYINSSYSSEFVCVPQYTIRLNKSEFNSFCIGLPQKNTQIIKFFFKKYFLKNNLKIRYDENNLNNNPSLRSKWIAPSKGIYNEIDLILNSSNIFYVGWLKYYSLYIQELFE